MLDNAIHHQAQTAAQQSAIRLMSYADAVWPDGPMLDLVIEQVLNEAVSFSVNARRVLDALKTTNVVQQSEWDKDIGQPIESETDLRRCLNAIIHAHELQVIVSPTGRTKFADGRNVQTHGLLANTDRYANLHIDLFGLAWSFMTMPRQTKKQ